MFLGSKFVYVSEDEEEEKVSLGDASSEEEYFDSDDGEVCIILVNHWPMMFLFLAAND